MQDTPFEGGEPTGPPGGLTPDLNIGTDPGFGAPNLNVSGTATIGTGLTVTAGGATIIAGGTIIQAGGANITGGLAYDAVSGGPPAVTTTSQSLSAQTASITMTGSGRVIYLTPSTSLSSCTLTPTGSASVTNGAEVTLVNLHASSASTITIPSGAGAGPQAITISGTEVARFMYVAPLQIWSKIGGF